MVWQPWLQCLSSSPLLSGPWDVASTAAGREDDGYNRMELQRPTGGRERKGGRGRRGEKEWEGEGGRRGGR